MSMNIAIISDTHLKKNSGQLDNLITEFRNVDLVIHAGAYGGAWVIEYLQNHFNFIGVCGNIDDNTIKAHLQEKLILKVGPYQIGVCHGHGKMKTTIERAYTNFQNNLVDIIIFGHSHQPMIKTMNKVLMLNPGSLTHKRQERWFSYILLTVDFSGIKAKLIFNELSPKIPKPPPHEIMPTSQPDTNPLNKVQSAFYHLLILVLLLI
ncbi:MAG: putative phosphoesterase [Firmicutes bacterium]|nr:putative phosphoesterase [Bacillota bacterium]